MEPMDLSVLAELAINMASRAALAGGFRALLNRDPGVIDSAVTSTCDQFEDIEAEPALQRWAASATFERIYIRLERGERDFGDEIVDSFIQDGEFFLPDDAIGRETAADIAITFVRAVLEALHQSDRAMSVHVNRQEMMHAETVGLHQETLARLERLEGKLTESGPAPTVALPEATPAGVTTDPEHAKLTAQIDLAHGMYKKGNVASARTALEQLLETAEEIPEDLRYRVLATLGACALAADDTGDGCTYLEEAYRLQPHKPAAVTNAATAARLRNDPHKAEGLARRALGLEPGDPHAAAVLMESLWDAGEAEEFEQFVVAEGWVTDDRQCALTLATIRTDQRQFDEAIALSERLAEDDPEDYDARLVLAGGLLAAAQNGHHGDLIAGCREAESQATEALRLLEATELRARYLHALSIRAGARLFRRDSEGAMDDIESVLREAPDDPSTLYNKGLILLEAEEFAGAMAVFDRIEDSEMNAKALMPHAAAAFWSDDPARAAELLRGSFSLDQGDWDDIRKAELLTETEHALGIEDSVEPLLDQALSHRPGDARLVALAGTRQAIRGDVDQAEDALLKAVELSTESDCHEFVVRLASFYNRQDRHSDAVDRYSEVVNGDVLHPAAIPLLGSLRSSGRLRDALAWAQKIREQHPRPPKIALETETQILNHVGDVEAAAERWRDICSRDDATMSDRVWLADALRWHGEREPALSVVREIDSTELLDDPQQLVRLARLKRLLGEPGYLDDAYVARRHRMDDSEIHLAYFALFMSQDSEVITPEVVEPGCAVLLKRDSEEKWWVILDGGEELRDSHETQADSDLAGELLGRRRGEIVRLQEGVGELSYEIADIRSKYVRALQATVSEFPSRFPRNTDLTTISVSEDDFAKFFGLVDERDKFVRGLHELYQGGQVPFAFLCAYLGRPAPEVWRAFTESGDVRIRFGTGSEQETVDAAQKLQQADSVVLDMLALLTTHALGLEDAARERFNSIAVPQQVVDEIQQLVYETSLRGQPRGYVGRNLDGSYAWMELSEEEWVEHQEFARSLLELAESFDRIASYPMLDQPLDELDILADALTRAGVAAIFAGGEEMARPLLVSDDFGLSAIAREFGATTVNTQAVLIELRRAEILTDVQYSAHVGKLAELNYRFIRVDTADMLRLFEANDYMTNEGTRALLKMLEGPECSQESAVRVVSGLIVTLATRQLPHEALLVDRLLSHLHRGRRLTMALWECRATLESWPGLPPPVRSRVLRSVDEFIEFWTL